MENKPLKNHIIICGLGTVGFRTYQLLKAAKQDVVIISDKVEAELQWQVEKSGGIFYLGDARSDLILIQAGIKEAKVILALTDEDMTNTTIAMDARKLNSHIKIIVRMLDNELGKYISKSFDIHQIFSTTDLAAPVFAESIFGESVIAQFNFNTESFIIQKENKNNMDLDLIDNSLIADSEKLFINKDTIFNKTISIADRFLKKINYLRSPAFEHLRLFLLILFCVIFSAALFLKWAMNLNFVDALYFVTTTVTTVGYGDINFLHSPVELKIFGCLLMLTGAAAIAVLFSSITEIILTQKLPSVVGGSPVPKKGHVIVVGAGNLGNRIVNMLIEKKIPIAIIKDKDKTSYPADINHQVALIDGNATSVDTLQRANIQTARAILIITDNDMDNLSVSLAVKKINSGIIAIAKINNEKLGSRLETMLSLNSVFSIATISAPYFAAAALGKEILVAFLRNNHLIFLSKTAQKETDTKKKYSILNIEEYFNAHTNSVLLNQEQA